MFGLLLGALSWGAFGVAAASRSVENHRKRNAGLQKKARGEKWENTFGTYFDVDGVERDLQTNTVAHTTRKNGELVQTDMYGRTVRNLTQERRRIEFEREKTNNNGATVVRILQEPNVLIHQYKAGYYDTINCAKNIFRDIRTGEVLFERLMGSTPVSEYKGEYLWRETDDDEVKVVQERYKQIKESFPNELYGGICFFVDSKGKLIRLADCEKNRGLDSEWVKGYINYVNTYWKEKYITLPGTDSGRHSAEFAKSEDEDFSVTDYPYEIGRVIKKSKKKEA